MGSDFNIPEAVKLYGMIDKGDRIAISRPKGAPIEAIKANKPAILAYIRAEREKAKAAAAEREEKIDNIPGLRKLESAIQDLSAWHCELQANIAAGSSGVGLRPRPAVDIDGLTGQYPRATNYLVAKEMSLAYNDVKAAAGKAALERIINGEDGVAALEEAEKAWGDYCMAHID